MSVPEVTVGLVHEVSAKIKGIETERNSPSPGFVGGGVYRAARLVYARIGIQSMGFNAR